MFKTAVTLLQGLTCGCENEEVLFIHAPWCLIHPEDGIRSRTCGTVHMMIELYNCTMRILLKL
jgi:hypothetical protein